MPTISVPDYAGGSLVNLVAELEARLGGTPASPTLHAHLAGRVPDAASYVLVVFDGLGDGQLAHPAAAPLAHRRVEGLDAPFPATTTVSLASVASGLVPARHGLLGYQLWLPEVAKVVNTIKWTTLWGDTVDIDTSPFLPAANLWERLTAAGAEPITVQPAGFAGTALTKALYRGCRFEGVAAVDEWVDAVVHLAATPGRLILAYLPQVDYAAHTHGQDSAQYMEALSTVVLAWERMARRLPAGTVAIGTADHGHIDFPENRRVRIPLDAHEGRIFYGDGRAMLMRGPNGAELAAAVGATWVPLAAAGPWWGPGPPHPAFADRAPDGVLLADDDTILLHRFSDTRLVGNHGAMAPAERRIPLLVAPRGKD
jgi:hypothetical protein